MKAITGNSTSKKLITKFISGGRPVIFGASLLHVIVVPWFSRSLTML